jgi:phosphatidylglycerol:prolipoprotein diacylglycerol transferase
MRKMTQVIAVVPAVVAFLLLRPVSFAEQTLLQFSTSQWVALLTAVPAALAYGVYFKAAEAHPASALAVDLDEFYRAHPEAVQGAADEGGGEPSSPAASTEESATAAAGDGATASESKGAEGEHAG